jgi:hypothetical protein
VALRDKLKEWWEKRSSKLDPQQADQIEAGRKAFSKLPEDQQEAMLRGALDFETMRKHRQVHGHRSPNTYVNVQGPEECARRVRQMKRDGVLPS